VHSKEVEWHHLTEQDPHPQLEQSPEQAHEEQSLFIRQLAEFRAVDWTTWC
jgi:hypothetical protein